MINTMLAVATLLVLGLPSAILFIPWTLITGNVNPLYNAACWIARCVLRAAGIRVVVEGRGPRTQQFWSWPTPVSNLDPPALYPHVPGAPTP